MSFGSWRAVRQGLTAVALATAAFAPAQGAAWEFDDAPPPLELPLDMPEVASYRDFPHLLPVPIPGRVPGPASLGGEPGPGVFPEAPGSTTATLEEPIWDGRRAEESSPPPPTSPSYPVVINNHVEALIDYFSARERERFRMWIARSGRYLDMIQGILREQGLPEELAYTAMIESGFSPRAVSRVGAKGMWQFMEATGRRYGLVVSRWVDERLDPVKSTLAAARYLGDLYGLFGHWFLAQAAYNAGETRVARAIQRARTSDFWALTQTRHLPDETKMFVPQILAATVITRDPGRYGFEEILMEPPLVYDEVTVRRAIDFETIAELAGVTVEAIRDLNTALIARITPPFGSYALRLPPGTGARFEAALRQAPSSRIPSWGIHRLARNQSLADVARIYRTTPQRLAEVNHLPGGRLRGVTELLVPVSARVADTAPAGRVLAARGGERGAVQPASVEAGREVVVQRGDTLWAIASRHGMKPQALARLNGMDLGDPLPVGARLRLQQP
jgi:membrane-bound lytic murein transglycosylase D